MRLLLTALIALGIGLAAGYGIGMRTGTEEDTSPRQDEVRIATVRLQKETERLWIDISYPQFGFAGDARIRKLAEEAAAGIEQLAANPPAYSAAAKFSATGYFDSIYTGPDVVSVRMVLSTYTGGAHGSSTISGFNFARPSGRELSLDDALSMLSQTLSQVAATATSELKARLGSAIFPEGATAARENYSTFLVGADKVTFVFQEYQVAPYAAGPQEVSLWRQPPGQTGR
jgi:hypothetical protein